VKVPRASAYPIIPPYLTSPKFVAKEIVDVSSALIFVTAVFTSSTVFT